MRSRRVSPAKIILAIATIAALGWVGWLAIRTAAVATLPVESPALDSIAPDSPGVVFGRAMADFREKRGSIGEQSYARVAQAARNAPLEFEPFLLFGQRAIARGEGARGLALLEEAQRRRPRETLTRVFLIDRYLRAGRIADAIAEISDVGRLLPDIQSQIVPALAGIAIDPKLAAPMRQALRNDPVLLNGVLIQLVAMKADPALILRMGQGMQPPIGDAVPRWQGELVQSLVNQGKPAQAYALWLRFNGVQSAPLKRGIYDPDFQDKPGGPPFGWKFTSGDIGAVDHGQGTLSIDFYGRQSGEFARELLLLKPGSYQLSMNASGSARGASGYLEWQLLCVGSRTPLSELSLKGLDGGKMLATGFTVPAAGCPAQWLMLRGIAGEFPDEQNIQITNLAIQHAGEGE